MATAVAQDLHQQEEEILWAAHRQLEKMRWFFYRVFAVISLFLLAPWLLAAYVATVAWRHVYLRVARWRWPDLDVVSPVTVRALMDTRRNQALLTAVVGLRTAVDLAALQARVSERLVELCAPGGGLRYPRLRHALTAACGRYAWREEDAFQLEAHVVAAPALPAPGLDHPWAQQAACDVAARFLPHALSPWQVALLPGGRVVVVRLHHLLQAEGPRLLDVVSAVCAAALLQEDDEMPPPLPPPQPPPPAAPLVRALPALWAELCDAAEAGVRAAVQRWQPAAGAAPADLPALLAVAAGSWAADGCGGLSREGSRPTLTAADALRAFSPPAVFWASLRVWWWVWVAVAVRLPLWLSSQVALLAVRGRSSPLGARWRLAAAAAAELRWLCLQTIDAPVLLLRHAVRPGNASARSMRAGSFTGRKVVAWSRRVTLPEGGDAAALLSAVCLSLRAYFESMHVATAEDAALQCACPVPERVLCLAGAAHQPGLLALPLPTCPPCDFAAPGQPQAAATLWHVRRELRSARRQQVVLQRLLSDGCALPRLLPSALVRVLLNAASRCYPVRVCIVSAVDELVPASESLVIWQPPQGNVCLSLSLLLEKDGRVCRLAVMADSFVTPHHAAIAEAFPAAVDTIAQVLHEERRPAHRSPTPRQEPSPPPRPESPPPSPDSSTPASLSPDETPSATPLQSAPGSPAPSPTPTQDPSPPGSQHTPPPTPPRSPH